MLTNYPTLSIIIVNFNTANLLYQCLESINQYICGKINVDVWVIDNNSTDSSRLMLQEYQRAHSWIQAEFLSSNTGFAYANNIGIQRSTGQYVLLLNSDTYLIDDSICIAIEYLNQNIDVFGCGCSLLDAKLQPSVSYGNFPSFWTVVQEISSNNFRQLRAQVPLKSYPAVIDIDFPCGAFFLIRREHLKTTGLLDESYFMYFEEADLALQAKRAGLGIKLLKEVKVVHLGGGSSLPEQRLRQETRLCNSWRKYSLKNYGILHTSLLKSVLTGYFFLRTMLPFLPYRKDFLIYQKALKDGWL